MGNPIPPAYNEILNALMTWGKSGLIENTRVVRTYHPAAIDNVTGVPTLMPATVYKTGTIDKPYEMSHTSINQVAGASAVGSNVVDFNVNDIVGGPDTNLAHNAPLNGKNYKDAALHSEDATEYEKNVEKLLVPTIGDRMTKFLDNKVDRITDNFEDAQTFYKIQPLVKEVEVGETNEPLDTRKPIPKRYELLPTRIPCAIPGVLNCVMEVYDKADVKQPTYTYRTPNIEMYYRPDKERLTLNGSLDPNGDNLYIHMATDFTDIKPLSDSDPGDE